jgi:hypothetical protein
MEFSLVLDIYELETRQNKLHDLSLLAIYPTEQMTLFGEASAKFADRGSYVVKATLILYRNNKAIQISKLDHFC